MWRSSSAASSCRSWRRGRRNSLPAGGARGPVRTGWSQWGADPRYGPRPADRKKLLLRRSPMPAVAGRLAGRPALAREVVERYLGTGARTRERRDQRLGHQRDAYPRRRCCRNLRSAGRTPRLAAGESTLAGRRGRTVGRAGPAAIDVTTRISGFFRDAFPQLIGLLDHAVRAVASWRTPEQNFVRKHYLAELAAGRRSSRGRGRANARYRSLGPSREPMAPAF